MTEVTKLDPARRRRRHSAEFKANVVAACQHPGVSIASVALAHGINANLLRRWVADRERSVPVARQAPQGAPAATAQHAPELGFLPLQVAANAPHEESIRVEIRRGAVTMTVAWPASAAADCAAWMREFLR